MRLETIQSFEKQVEQGETFMSWDFKGGYRNFYFHPDMRKYFLFTYNGEYFCCIALPFGWGRHRLWFVKLLRPLVRYIRQEFGNRVYGRLFAGTIISRTGGDKEGLKGGWEESELGVQGAGVDEAPEERRLGGEQVDIPRWCARRYGKDASVFDGGEGAARETNGDEDPVGGATEPEAGAGGLREKVLWCVRVVWVGATVVVVLHSLLLFRHFVT